MDNRQSRHERYNSPVHAARQDAVQAGIRRAFADQRTSGRLSPDGDANPSTTAGAGSVRHSLTVLLPVAAATELVLGLVGGLPALGLGATAIAATALLAGRYVAGAASQDSGLRREARLMTSRVPGLGDWYWTVRNGVDDDGYASALRPQLQRLFAAKLSEQHGVSLYAEPAKAAELIGPANWPWLDPEQPAPARTIPADRLGDLIQRLDTL
ncbi:hypothetical protein [Kitasatospora viridis]|uniref:Uncharacterized protein n=1 Tax=Kitasatospora viridis TaxID=281105 RepID=A0A561UBL2_9ACTN|nr:hypothetical protein [Kitasatospora viridis]TWF96729.1 hypothetical protein FHX73_11501 [Kitasatospora viridis]